MTATFNLTTEPWILVRTRERRTEEVSLRDLFLRAPELVEIVGDLPTQAFAILRVALAVLHRAVEGPQDEEAWHALADAGQPPQDQIDAYLDRVFDRMDLRHPQHPFFQVAELCTAKGEVSGLERLVADAPTRHPHFSTRIGRGLNRITWAEAARWLVHVQAFDFSGIKSGAVGDPRAATGRGFPIGVGWAGLLGGVYVTGPTLWDTLLLNLIPVDQPMYISLGSPDRPAWEEAAGVRQAEDLPARPYGALDSYTWQSRRVRLHGDAAGVTGVVIANGDPAEVAGHVAQEPMTAWTVVEHSRPTGDQHPVTQEPRRHRPSRALWRGLSALLPVADAREPKASTVAPGVLCWAGQVAESPELVRVRAVGMHYISPTQKTWASDVIDDELVLPAALLSGRCPALVDMILSAVSSTEVAARDLQNLAADLVRAAGGSDDRLASGARDRAAERAFGALDGEFRRWLGALGLDSETDAARADWHATATRILGDLGDDLVREAGPSAWVGRTVAKRHISTPEADERFRRALRAALPPPDASSPDDGPTDQPPTSSGGA